jgi:hypothetical protein
LIKANKLLEMLKPLGQSFIDAINVQKSKLPGKRELIELIIRPLFLQPRVKHIDGPSEISYASDELIVICVVRNGELYVKSFMEHYLSMGIKHFVFMDNGSTDRTVEMLSQYDKVTMLQANAPYQKYENTMKRYLADRFSKDRWHLCADIDELFDYPYSTSLKLRDFLRYLNQKHYTAVVTQMLDMFSATPLGELESKVNDSLKEKYTYYDLSAVGKTDYGDYGWSEPTNRRIKLHRGGIRNSLFGTNNGLTKAALVRMDGKVRTFIAWHHVKDARVADISCVLKHYPFISSFYTKVQDAVQTGRYGRVTSDEYTAYWKELERNPSLNLKLETAQRFTSLEALIEEEFLVVSDQYRQWVSNHI